MQPGFYGSNFRLNDLRYFFEGQLFVLAENQDFTLKSGQRLNGSSDSMRNFGGSNVHGLSYKLLVFQFLPSAFTSPSLEREISCGA